MKKVIFIMTTIFLAFCSQMQAQDTTQMLLKLSRPSYLGLYIAPEYQYGQLSGDFTSMAGSSVMLLVNKRFAVGATMQHSLDAQFSPTNLSPLKAQTTFGGLKMEYTAKPNSALHLTFPLVVGMGMVRADSITNYGRNSDWNGRYNTQNSFIVVQPGVQLEGNLFRYAKIFAGANYRLAFQQEVNNAKIGSTALQGFSANVGLKFGIFDYKIRAKKEKTS